MDLVALSTQLNDAKKTVDAKKATVDDLSQKLGTANTEYADALTAAQKIQADIEEGLKEMFPANPSDGRATRVT